MIKIIFGLIPGSVKAAARDALVEAVITRGEGLLSEPALKKLGALRSDAKFRKKYNAALEAGIQRFYDEYVEIDEDLAGDLVEVLDLVLADKEVKNTLLRVIKEPNTYQIDNKEQVIQAFEAVLPRRRNRERVNRAVSYFVKCVVQELWHLPELQAVYMFHFQRMTAEGVREQVSLQRQQLAALNDLGSGIQQALLQLSDGLAERLLEAGSAVEEPVVRHNLNQPTYELFIGRKSAIVEIQQRLRPREHSRVHVVTIDGIGGIGKSTLALEVAYRYLREYHQLEEGDRFDAIVWVSAKSTLLTGQGVLARRQVFRNLLDIYSEIAHTLGRKEIVQSTLKDQHTAIRRALAEQRTLLILDNLETVDDEHVLSFLRELPLPTKALVTTRHRIYVAYPVRLTELDWDDARQLIEHECRQQNVEITEELSQQVFANTGGVPLAIKWLIAQIDSGYTLETALKRLSERQGDVLRFIFEDAVNRIRGKAAYRLLLALSLFSPVGTRNALGVVANVENEVARDEGLAELERLSLINKSGHRFSLLPLTLTYVSSELEQVPENKDAYIGRWLSYYVEFANKYGDHFFYWYDFDILNERGENILDAIDVAIEREDIPIALKIIPAAIWYIDMNGRWLEAIDLCETGMELALVSNNYIFYSGITRKLGWIFGQMGRTEGSVFRIRTKTINNLLLTAQRSQACWF